MLSAQQSNFALIMAHVLLCLIALCVSVIASTEKPSDRAHRQCAEETNLDPTLKEGNRWLETQNNPVYKEYMLCFCRKMGFLDAEGRFQRDAMRTALATLFAEDQLDPVLDRCIIRKRTLQESAYETVKCIDVNIPRGRRRV